MGALRGSCCGRRAGISRQTSTQALCALSCLPHRRPSRALPLPRASAPLARSLWRGGFVFQICSTLSCAQPAAHTHASQTRCGRIRHLLRALRWRPLRWEDERGHESHCMEFGVALWPAGRCIDLLEADWRCTFVAARSDGRHVRAWRVRRARDARHTFVWPSHLCASLSSVASSSVLEPRSATAAPADTGVRATCFIVPHACHTRQFAASPEAPHAPWLRWAPLLRCVVVIRSLDTKRLTQIRVPGSGCGDDGAARPARLLHGVRLWRLCTLHACPVVSRRRPDAPPGRPGSVHIRAHCHGPRPRWRGQGRQRDQHVPVRPAVRARPRFLGHDVNCATANARLFNPDSILRSCCRIPSKVTGFLDVTGRAGAWDPTLAFVSASA